MDARVAELTAVRPAGGLPLGRLLGLVRSHLCSSARLLSRRFLPLLALLAVPTALLTFLLRTVGSLQASRRRRALSDIAQRRRQEARDNIESTRVNSAKFAEVHQDVLGLGFLVYDVGSLVYDCGRLVFVLGYYVGATVWGIRAKPLRLF